MYYDKLIEIANDDMIGGAELSKMLREHEEFGKLLRSRLSSVAPLSINLWISEFGITDLRGQLVSTVYDSYLKWCDKYNAKPESAIKFSKVICAKFGLVSKVATIDGRSKRKYV